MLQDRELDQYQETLLGIARSIELLKPQYPQLAEFDADTHCDLDDTGISYGYKTHWAPQTGGWSSGVPHPDPDGVWFYVGIFDSSSTRQIHHQLVVPRWRLDDKEAMVLLLDGADTKSLNGAISKILLDHGLATVGLGGRPSN